MELYWVSEFEIGNEYVDLQHRYFLDLITRIGKNLKETNDDDYIRRLIVELHKYADFHFASEENIAISCGLPGVKNHHQLHLELLEDLNQCCLFYTSRNKCFCWAESNNIFVFEYWCNNHNQRTLRHPQYNLN